jgi:hypothetical protein
LTWRRKTQRLLIGRLDQMPGRLAEIEWQLTRYLTS